MTHTHTVEIFDNSMQVRIFSCYKKGVDASKDIIVFGYETFYVSVSNRKVNLIYSWRCTTTTTRRFILASA